MSATDTITTGFNQNDLSNSVWELFLLKLRFESEVLKVPENKPILLNDPDAVWMVYTGSVDVFVSRVEHEILSGQRNYLFSVSSGHFLFGFDFSGKSTNILMITSPGTEIVKVNLARIQEIAQDSEFHELVGFLLDRWIRRLSESVSSAIASTELIKELLPDLELSIKKGDLVRCRRQLLWVTHKAGVSIFMDRADIVISNDTYRFFPLSKGAWLHVQADGILMGKETKHLLQHDDFWFWVQRYQRQMLDSLTARMDDVAAQERIRIEKKFAADDNRLQDAFQVIASTLNSDLKRPLPSNLREKDPLLVAAIMVGEAMGIEIKTPPPSTQSRLYDPLLAIARASKIRTRQVALVGQWWKAENGPLLAYTMEDKRPLALLPNRKGYDLVDPVTQVRQPLTDALAGKLGQFGVMFYRPLPEHQLNSWDLIRFGLRGANVDLSKLLFLGILIGILQLATPFVTQIVFDEIIPQGSITLLAEAGLALFLSAFAIALFQISQAIAVLRLESRVEGSLQAAVWDRLLELPATFFRNYSAGDMGLRATGISTIRKTLSGTVTASILASIASLFNLVLLFYYSSTLALVGIALVLGAILITALLGRWVVSIQRTVTEMRGKISGYMLQFINGITKFRGAGAENRAFVFWADKFSEQRRVDFRGKSVQNLLYLFGAVYPVMSTAILFAALIYGNMQERLSIGAFLAFLTAFNQFLSSGLQLSIAMMTVLSLVPVYERLKPIIESTPEVDASKAHPGELRGKIEVDHVDFRYRENGPKVLHDVSFKVNPGEFVALVGPSGSGKSSILRLLLGFETPETGVVYYDGQDMAQLDVRSIRQQIGVVLQGSQIMPGSDIFTNIVGATTLTIDDAWQAATMAGFADDIKNMPMAMHTIVAPGTLSGGQKQRLIIARAIVTKPRIIFFDEATSALDNRTQAIVSESLEKLDATRIVIAHRLSTIINAHRIIVLQSGRIVQTGTYTELMNEKGLFAELAKRQSV